MLPALLLVIAVCIDAFATSISYGISKIKIPFTSALIISITGTGFLACSLFLLGYSQRSLINMYA